MPLVRVGAGVQTPQVVKKLMTVTSTKHKQRLIDCGSGMTDTSAWRMLQSDNRPTFDIGTITAKP
jgi:hypothetical protein